MNTPNSDSAGRAYWESKPGESLPGEASPKNAEPVEGRHEHPRGRRSGKLPVSYRRAKNPATPVSFGGLESGEEVIAKPSAISTDIVEKSHG